MLQMDWVLIFIRAVALTAITIALIVSRKKEKRSLSLYLIIGSNLLLAFGDLFPVWGELACYIVAALISLGAIYVSASAPKLK